MITKVAIEVVTAVCLFALCAEVVWFFASFLVKKRPEKIAFLRSFKKGKCAIIYVVAIPLYCIGHLYGKRAMGESVFLAINKSINLVVLKYDMSSISALMENNELYKNTVYFCFVLVAANALILTCSILNQHIWELWQSLRTTFTRKDKLFIFGNNSDNRRIYKSDKKRNKTIIDNMSDKDCEKLYVDKMAYISTAYLDKTIARLQRIINKRDRQYAVIINTGSDDKNIEICRAFIKNIDGSGADNKEHLFMSFRIYVFGDPRYEAVYNDIIASGYGCIHYVNKYAQMAMDFIDKYPLTLFMDETQIDYETSLVKDDVEINVFIIGFGETNQQIFLSSVANNQFMTAGKDGKPVLKAVNYHIFDKEESADNNKNLNHSYYRFKHERENFNSNEYLPLPEIPACEIPHILDINDKDFYNIIRDSLKKKPLENDERCNGETRPADANFIIIAFGSDLENIDMAQKLLEKRQEWGIKNLPIFVKVRKWRKDDTFIGEDGCYFIANEADTVYNIEKILNDKIYRMSQKQNGIYDIDGALSRKKTSEVTKKAVVEHSRRSMRKWYRVRTPVERESNVYVCLSLRSKLNLMGLDYCEKDNKDFKGLSEQEYLAIYARDDMPDMDAYSVTAEGRRIIRYGIELKASRRRTMAMLEHQRWNSYMITKGLVPASISQIKYETVRTDETLEYTNGKNYRLRRHGNITTFEGLEQFRKIVAARDGKSLAETDVIKYDYQLLDQAHWLLDSSGFKIIKKNKIQF